MCSKHRIFLIPRTTVSRGGECYYKYSSMVLICVMCTWCLLSTFHTLCSTPTPAPFTVYMYTYMMKHALTRLRTSRNDKTKRTCDSTACCVATFLLSTTSRLARASRHATTLLPQNGSSDTRPPLLHPSPRLGRLIDPLATTQR